MDNSLTEAIADARAEEKVKMKEIKMQETKQDNKFREELINGLRDVVGVKKEASTVKIPLDEYVMLKQKERDLMIILDTIVDNAEKGYIGGLRVESDEIMKVFKILYSNVYTMLLDELEQE